MDRDKKRNSFGFSQYILDFLPLIIFNYYSKYDGCGVLDDGFWAHAFGMGVLTALLQAVYFYYKQLPFDYIAVGSNLFLIGGFLGFLGLKPLLLPFGLFNRTSLFICIGVVGLIANFISKKGFLQVEEPARPEVVMRNSWILLGSVFGLYMLSLWLVPLFHERSPLFHERSYAGVALPLLALLGIRGLLRAWSTKS